MNYSIGLDFGTSSVRCLIVNIGNGKETSKAVYHYQSGDAGVILDPSDHNLARQNPAEYLQGLVFVTNKAIKEAFLKDPDFSIEQVIGIGVDTTGSTPLPVEQNGTPLAFLRKFKDNLNAQAWLWKDHTSYAEAQEITELAKKEHPEYLSKCGGKYSSEWFFSKILHCLRIDPEVFNAAYIWIECCDYITGVLTDNSSPNKLKIGRCAAGHKAMYNDEWGGFPSKDFLNKLDSRLGNLRDRLSDRTYTVDQAAGSLSSEWAKKINLKEGIPVAIGALDAHMGAIGAGVKDGTMVKIIGTSTCDILSVPNIKNDIPGISGIVKGSVLPNYIGLEAGQSAVGDIFNWFVKYIMKGGSRITKLHEELTEKAATLKAGQSGLMALDWNNGNRNILGDQRLSGLLIGQTLLTKPEEIYRALIEATAFGALMIINRIEKYGVNIKEIINCGGIAEKNELLLQIYSDVTGREMKISDSSQAPALGSAIAASVVAGEKKGGYDSFIDAQKKMCKVKKKSFKPGEDQSTYQGLFKIYQKLNNAFGLPGECDLSGIMKELLDIKKGVIK
jgi:L-ribulokinase